jgi:hypothetical protein
MQAAQLALRRQRAMLDFEAGRLPDAEAALNGLIDTLRAGEAAAVRYELCRALLDRATVLSFAHRWREALADLHAGAETAAQLAPISARAVLVNVHQQRAKLYATRLSPFYDRQAAHQELARLRALGFANWWTEELAADLAYQEGDWQAAAQGYLRLAQALQAEGWTRGVAASRLRAGRALLELGRVVEAERELGAALAFFEAYGPPDLLAAAQIHSARLRLARGEAAPAWKLAQAALCLVEGAIRQFRALFDQQRFVVDKLPYYQYAFAIGLAAGGEAGVWRAWQVAERAKSFCLCQLVANADVPLFEGVDASLLARLKHLEAQLDACEAGQARASDAAARSRLHDDLVRLSQERDAVLTSLMRAHPRWAALRAPPPLDVQQALQALPPGWAALSYFWQERPSGAILHLFFAGRGDMPRHEQIPWAADEVAALDEARRRLRQLPADQLWSVEELLPSHLVPKIWPDELCTWLHGRRSLLISPHGRLRATPLHALPLASGGCLVQHSGVQYIPTLGLLALARPSQPSSRVLLMGCERDGFGSPPLPEVPQELARLRAIWEARPGVIVTACECTPSTRFGAQLPGPERWREFGILHFACHGIFDAERPLDARLRLGQEALRASELFGVKLDAALACFSACDVGGQAEQLDGLDLAGDEWLGLAMPLLYAGARTLLVSLWPANSEQAVAFMEELHRQLSWGHPLAEAFRLAVVDVQDSPVAYWANWYVAGLPTEAPALAPASAEERT